MAFLAYICKPIGMLLGIIYPAYASFKALESKNIETTGHWLTYFTIFSLFTLTETIADFLISWIPFYYLMKLIIIFWLVSPTTQGAVLIYNSIIQPALKQNEERIDTALEEGRRQVQIHLLTLKHRSMQMVSGSEPPKK